MRLATLNPVRQQTLHIWGRNLGTRGETAKMTWNMQSVWRTLNKRAEKSRISFCIHVCWNWTCRWWDDLGDVMLYLHWFIQLFCLNVFNALKWCTFLDRTNAHFIWYLIDTPFTPQHKNWTCALFHIVKSKFMLRFKTLSSQLPNRWVNPTDKWRTQAQRINLLLLGFKKKKSFFPPLKLVHNRN